MKKNVKEQFVNNIFSTLNTSNMIKVNTDPFAGTTASEIDRLGSAVANDEELWVDDEGVLHTRNDAEGLSTLNTSNMTKVNTDPFAGTTAEELDGLAEAVANDEELWVDDEGVLHTRNDAEGLSTLNTSNMTKVNTDPFAGTKARQLDDIDDIYVEGGAPNPGTADEMLYFDENGILHSGNADESQSGTGSLDLDDGSLEMQQDNNEVVQYESDDSTERTEEQAGEDDSAQRAGVVGDNMYRVNNDPFAAVIAKPKNPDQWYNKNPRLFQGEVANMRSHYRNATLGFLKSTGNMYWIIELKIVKGLKPWKFLLEYDKDHPNNHGYGGSIHVQLLKSPSLDDLRARALASGRKGIPHTVKGKRTNGEDFVFLCTRFPKDIEDGKVKVSSAVQVAGWAADWALHFEAGLKSKEVWNKWCDDPHFRYLMIP